MKLTLIALLFALSACATKQTHLNESLFYSDVSGPSKESGDCGGYAFWLRKVSGQFKAGEVAEFEGGCGIHKRPLLEVLHNPATGEIKFYGVSSDPREYVGFEGSVDERQLVGVISQLDIKTRQPLFPDHAKQPRTFNLRDLTEFEKALPQNFPK